MQKIAIIRLSALGDIIISASMLGLLRSLGGFQIEWFVDVAFKDVLVNSPCIDRLHSLDFKRKLRSVSGIFELKKYCKKCGKFDFVIDMQGLVKSALIGNMLDSKHFIGFSFAGAREGVASFFYSKKIDISYHENILKRNFWVIFGGILEQKDSKNTTISNLSSHVGLISPVSLENALALRQIGFSYNNENLDSNLNKNLNLPQHTNLPPSNNINLFKKNDQSQDLITKSNIDSKIYRILFVLEASIKEKIYPAHAFIRLAMLLKEADKTCIFYLAYKNNTQSAKLIFNTLKEQNIESHKLQGLDFNALKYIFTYMDCVIGGDTGLTYLAWAMAVPCITLYGNSSSDATSQKNSKKNMKNTDISRILLGNPYIVSKTSKFEIESIKPEEIFRVLQKEILGG